MSKISPVILPPAALTNFVDRISCYCFLFHGDAADTDDVVGSPLKFPAGEDVASSYASWENTTKSSGTSVTGASRYIYQWERLLAWNTNTSRDSASSLCCCRAGTNVSVVINCEEKKTK